MISYITTLSLNAENADAGLLELPPNNYFAKLAAAIPKAKVSLDGKTITLPDGLYWPDLESDVLFVRHFFNGMWGGVLNCCMGRLEPRLKSAVLLGSPGSTFCGCAVACVYHALRCCYTMHDTLD